MTVTTMIYEEDMHRTIVRLQKEADTLREGVAFLEKRIEGMNAVFGEVRMAVGSNQFDQQHPEDFNPDCPWLPVGLMSKIDDVMMREQRS